MQIGSLIRGLRKQRRFSANALANEAGVTINTVLSMERGANVTMESFRIVLGALHRDKPLDANAVRDLLTCLGIEPDQIRCDQTMEAA